MKDDRPVVIFGNRSLASLAWYCLTHDSQHRVAGFTVDAAYCHTPLHEGLAVVPFEILESVFPPDAHLLLIALGTTRINGLRRERYEQAKARGYQFASYISSRASVWPDLQIGENCLIFEHAVIQPFATIGSNVIIRAGANIGHHCMVESHCFIATEATFGGNANIGEQTFIGLGAIVRDGLRIAERTLVGAGAVVITDTEADGVYIGNPAQRMTKSSFAATERSGA
jgi:sugar O-acyltransferase (sialic acid O-acetyltransferase NeuD family)